MIKVNAVAGIAHSAHDDELGPASGEAPAETTVVTFVNPAHIRSFGPRKDGRQGSRIVFANGIGMPVHDTPEQLAQALDADE